MNTFVGHRSTIESGLRKGRRNDRESFKSDQMISRTFTVSHFFGFFEGSVTQSYIITEIIPSRDVVRFNINHSVDIQRMVLFIKSIVILFIRFKECRTLSRTGRVQLCYRKRTPPGRASKFKINTRFDKNNKLFLFDIILENERQQEEEYLFNHSFEFGGGLASIPN